MDRVLFVPNPGVVIRDPRSFQRVPPEGKVVPYAGFYRRMVEQEKCGEALPVPAPEAPAPEPETT